MLPHASSSRCGVSEFRKAAKVQHILTQMRSYDTAKAQTSETNVYLNMASLLSFRSALLPVLWTSILTKWCKVHFNMHTIDHVST